MTALERMRLYLGDSGSANDKELSLYLEDAMEFILGYIRKDELPPQLNGAWVRAAVAMYNRRGMEGQARISAGGTQRVADALPADLMRLLHAYRAARVINLRAEDCGMEGRQA